jgi:murein DD-endopeptidase MepM/ murein hydrolase activator NlpD
MKNSLDALSDKLARILGQLDQIESKVGGGSGGSGGSGGGLMDGSLANVSTTAAPASAGGAFMGFASKVIGAAAGFAGGMSMAMPDLGSTIARRGGFYQAGVASGGMMTHGALERSVRLGLGQFSTSAGSDSAVAAMLTTRGMVPGSSTFNSTITAVGQAARYLNMPNEVAASALEGLTSGPTSSMMLRNFGVFTADPRTGEARSQAEIFEQLAQRFTSGRETTLEGTMESLRRGALGSNIRNSGLDSAQQALFSQYMIDRSRGVKMDLEDPDAISIAMGDRDNPFTEQYRQNSADNQLMERATDTYLSGMETASDMLIKLKDSLEGLPDLFYEIKGGADFFLGDKAGQGTLAAATSLMQIPIVGPLLAGLFGANMLQVFGGGGTGAGSSTSSFGPPTASGVGFHSPSSGAGYSAQGRSNSGVKIGAGGGGNVNPGVAAKNWTGAYGEPRDGGRVHEGVDVAMAVGTSIKAVMDGTVVAAGTLGTWGIHIRLSHGAGKETIYAHLSKHHVRKGDVVKKGNIIGKSGNTGKSTGPHLHFQYEVHGSHRNPNHLVGLAYGGGGTPPTGDAQNIEPGSDNSTTTATSVQNSFMAVNWQGVSGGSMTATDMVLSTLGGGILAGVSNTAGTSLPKPISGRGGQSQLTRVLSNNGSAIGGAEGYMGASGSTSSDMDTLSVGGKSAKTQVTINVTVAKASESEARRFAKMVKQQLEEDSTLTSMGSK